MRSHNNTERKILKTMVTSALVRVLSGAAVSQRPVSLALNVDVAKPGPEIDRHIYGQFAEHLGRGIYDGIWVC